MIGLGPRLSKIYWRNAAIFAAGILFWWATAKYCSYLGLGKLTFWLSAPFMVIAFASWLGLCGIGPFNRGIKEAIEADKAEMLEETKSKQPWE